MMLYIIYIGFFVMVFVATPDLATEQQVSPWLALAAPLALLVGLAIVMVSFWALFFRKAAATFQMDELSAGFEVSTAEWLKFYAKLIGLTVITLGFGILMWSYFRWKFTLDRLELFGEVNLDRLKQSETEAPRDAEGFADAFDIGAF
jgi:hypothetical protein